VAGEQDEIKAVFDLVDAIFNGDTGHLAMFLWLTALRRAQ
jgi:hypothetical protein